MKREEFEKLISQDPHKDDIMSIVDEGIELGKFHDQTLEDWYDDSAQLYKSFLAEYVHCKFNYARRLDSFRYLLFQNKWDLYLQKQRNKDLQRITDELDNFAQTHYPEYNDKEILEKIRQLLQEYSRNALFLETKVEELQDSARLVELDLNLQSSARVFNQVKFEVFKVHNIITHDIDGKKEKVHTTQNKESYVLKSNKAKLLFTDCFLHYFKNRFIEYEYDLDILNEKIEYYQDAKKKLLKKLIRDIYLVFIAYNKLDFTNKNDTYHFGIERNGKYPSLKSDVSEWIFDLLFNFSYVNRIKDEEVQGESENKVKKKNYIRNCMEDERVINWKMERPSTDFPYL